MNKITKYELCLVTRSEDGSSITLYEPYDLEDLPDDVVKGVPEQIRRWEDYLADELDRRGFDQ